MTYLVVLADDTLELVPEADAYQLEGPLTTFFRTAAGRQVVDCWSTRLASFRTVDVRRIRAIDASTSDDSARALFDFEHLNPHS
ncbi:MAG: hypothetical protein AB7L13_06365 [Acidimicrobiia bacterium]